MGNFWLAQNKELIKSYRLAVNFVGENILNDEVGKSMFESNLA